MTIIDDTPAKYDGIVESNEADNTTSSKVLARVEITSPVEKTWQQNHSWSYWIKPATKLTNSQSYTKQIVIMIITV